MTVKPSHPDLITWPCACVPARNIRPRAHAPTTDAKVASVSGSPELCIRAAVPSASGTLPRLAWPETTAFQETASRCRVPSNKSRVRVRPRGKDTCAGAARCCAARSGTADEVWERGCSGSRAARFRPAWLACGRGLQKARDGAALRSIHAAGDSRQGWGFTLLRNPYYGMFYLK
jgi:hypothetical protein